MYKIQSYHKGPFMHSLNIQNLFLQFLYFSKFPGTIFVKFPNSGDQKCKFSKLFTQVLFLITFYFKRTWVDFSCKINAQGLVWTIFESSGTENVNYANLTRFLSVFNPFVPETYKNTIK